MRNRFYFGVPKQDRFLKTGPTIKPPSHHNNIVKTLLIAICVIAVLALAVWIPIRSIPFDSASWMSHTDISSSHGIRSRMESDLMSMLNKTKPDRKSVEQMLGLPNESFKPGDELDGNIFQKPTAYYWLANPLGGQTSRTEGCERLVIEYDELGRVLRAYRDVYST